MTSHNCIHNRAITTITKTYNYFTTITNIDKIRKEYQHKIAHVIFCVDTILLFCVDIQSILCQ